MLALQRRLLTHDGAKWRTVTRVTENRAPDAMEFAEGLASVGEAMEWCIVLDDIEQKPVANWTLAQGWH